MHLMIFGLVGLVVLVVLTVLIGLIVLFQYVFSHIRIDSKVEGWVFYESANNFG
jgi:hypothetical protein